MRKRRARRKRRMKKFDRSMKSVLVLIFLICVVLFAALLGLIYWTDHTKGNEYKKAALSQQSYTNSVLNYQRGTIRDRNNTTLAVSERKYDLVLEPRTLKTDDKAKAETIQKISEFFKISSDVLEKRIAEKPTSMYEHFDELRQLSVSKVEKFKDMMEEDSAVKGVWFEETYTRKYPLNTVACNLVGFMSSDETGTYGVEESYNDILTGTTGREYGYFDSNMNLQRTVKEAKDGDSIVLTIDANVQKIVEQQIADFQKNNVGAERIAVMLMNPKNGQIIAMASNSTFDLNNPQDLSLMYTQKQIAAMSDKEKNDNLLAMWSNYCIGSAYEPGSTYKPFTISAALDENLISDSSSFNCTGVKKVGDREIHCSNRSGHGLLDLRHSLMASCNIALMDIGLKLGRSKFYNYNKLYGFGQRTGVDLPGETSGLVFTEDQLNPVELAISSFGQTQTVTMVQMLSGFSSLINGGNYYQPHVVKEIQNSRGDTIETVDPVVVRKTTTEETSKLIRSYLKSTVEQGTASPAKIKGYSLGGKTGTAQKRPVTARKYLVSFIGCVPAEDPEIAYYVLIDEPHVKDQAHSTYATEFSAKIMKKVLPFLGQYAEK